MASYEVADSTQVNFKGVVYSAGDVFDAEPGEVADEVTRRLVELVPPVKKRASTRA